MLLNLTVKDANNNPRGSAKVRLDFWQKRWYVVDDKPLPWQYVGFSKGGTFEQKDWNVSWVWDKDPDGTKRNTIIFWDPPVGKHDVKNSSGRARLYDPKDSTFKDCIISWTVDRITPELSPIRQAMLDIIKVVPNKGLSSDDKDFKTLTGFDTARLKKDYWDVATVPDPKDPEPDLKKKRQIPNPSRDFTTCNAFLARVVGMLSDKIGVPAGRWLSGGVLQLDLVDKDVKGSWVPTDPTGILHPRPGDVYAAPHINKKGHVQKFGHVGIVGSFDDGLWSSVDGGQGGREGEKDYIKRVSRGIYYVGRVTGWCDIDKYFGGPVRPKVEPPKTHKPAAKY
jgi:hypothetical protein